MPCAISRRQETLSTTMMTFFCLSTCPLSTQRLQLRTHSVYSTFTNKSYKFPHLPIPNSSSLRSCASPSDSRTSPQSGRFQEIAPLCGTMSSVAYVLNVRRRVRSCLPRFNIQSPQSSHHFEVQWLLVDVPGRGSPPTLSHSNSLLCH